MSQKTELLNQAGALCTRIAGAIIPPPEKFTPGFTSELASLGRRLNAVLCELENVTRGTPEPRQRRD